MVLNRLVPFHDYISERTEGYGFEWLYHTHADAVYSFLMFKLRDEYLAEELLQDTFLAVYEQGGEGYAAGIA